MSSGESCSEIQALISPKGYKVEKALGKGAFGVVYKAVNPKSNQTVAVKVINMEKLSDNMKNKMLPREIDTLLQCHHEHLIQTYDILRTEKKMLIIMQFAPNGDISGFSKKHNGIKDELACKWFLQASSGLGYLHGTLFRAHRDIKSANMLLDSHWRALLADMGFAKKCYDERKDVVVLSKTFCGTRPYECPQILEHKPYNAFKADIWSMGVTLYHMLHKRNYPFDHKESKKMLKQIHKYPHHLRKSIKKGLPKEAVQLFEEMLNPNERERASVRDILKNQWLRNKAAKG